MNKKYISKILLVMVACIIAYLFLLPLMFMVFTSFKGTAEAITSTSFAPPAMAYWKIMLSCLKTQKRLPLCSGCSIHVL